MTVAPPPPADPLDAAVVHGAVTLLTDLGYAVTPPAAPAPFPAPSPSVTPPRCLSGAAGVGVADGTFAAWRGRPVDLITTYADRQDKNTGWIPQTDFLDLKSGGKYASWPGSIDIAVGAIYSNKNAAGAQAYGAAETWELAATGAYDARWTASLTQLAALWRSVPARLAHVAGVPDPVCYIRFAHEFNGDWYDWLVKKGQEAAFIAAWKRYRALQKQIFPESKLVFCPNGDTTGGTNGLDWRQCFPGAAYVDVMGVDSYNAWNHAVTAADFATISVATSWPTGSPKGVEAHRQFALSVGLPFAVCEWGNPASDKTYPGQAGESPAYIDCMKALFAKGVLYESYFNVGGYPYTIFPGVGVPSAQPLTSAEYAKP